MVTLMSQKYTITDHQDGTKKTYIEILSENGRMVRTYRPDGTLYFQKEFNSRGQYTVTRFDNSGIKEEYHTIGGLPDQRTCCLFHQGRHLRKKIRHLQKTRGE